MEAAGDLAGGVVFVLDAGELGELALMAEGLDAVIEVLGELDGFSERGDFEDADEVFGVAGAGDGHADDEVERSLMWWLRGKTPLERVWAVR